MPRLSTALFLVAFLTVACSRGNQTNAQSTPSPLPSPTSTAAATAASSPNGSALLETPQPAVSAQPHMVLPQQGSVASPAASATVFAPAAGPSAQRRTDLPPKIVAVSLNERTVRSGDRVVGRVRTSLNTASVEARIGGYSVSLTKTAAGLFAVDYQIPWIPFFLHGKYDIVLIARTTSGTQTRELVPIEFQ